MPHDGGVEGHAKAVILFFFPNQFMGLFGNDPTVVALSAKYARIVAFSFFFDCITSVYVAAHRSMANPKPGLYIFTKAGLTLNFLLVKIWNRVITSSDIRAMRVARAAPSTPRAGAPSLPKMNTQFKSHRLSGPAGYLYGGPAGGFRPEGHPQHPHQGFGGQAQSGEHMAGLTPVTLCLHHAGKQ